MFARPWTETDVGCTYSPPNSAPDRTSYCRLLAGREFVTSRKAGRDRTD
jgi:hypothetical protein